MNAYELANKMEQLAGHFHNEAINMLRQQADRIAELEKSHIELEKGIVADLNQRQSAKPVAWMDYLEHSNVYDLNVSGRGIPLYTTPQIKELSDEEIIEIGNAVTNLIDSNEGWIEFARAILKKASEK